MSKSFRLSILLTLGVAWSMAASAQTALPSAAESAAPALTPTAQSATASADTYTITYVCGDASLDQQPPPASNGRAYNLGVTFASAQTGEALSNVAVRLRRHGRVLLDFQASGPRCLFSVPEADYRLEGTYDGQMKFEIVQSGTLNTQMRW
jgi:hypothetical protein